MTECNTCGGSPQGNREFMMGAINRILFLCSEKQLSLCYHFLLGLVHL